MPISQTLLGVLIGGLFTLAGSVAVGLFHYFRTKTEVRAEDRRLTAELYLERKVEALTTLHAELEECQRGLMRILDRVPSEEFGAENEEKEAEKLIEEFEVAMDRASVYLTEEQHKTVLSLYTTLEEVNGSIKGWRMEPVDMRREGNILQERHSDLIKEYEEVKQLLQEEIREPIEELDG